MPNPNADRQLSATGFVTLARFESYRQFLYDDSAGKATIGFGHLVHHGPVGTNSKAEAPFVKGLSVVAAMELMLDDTLRAVWAVLSHVRVPLTQPRFDALVSFAYNVGAEAFAESTLLRVLNDNKFDLVPSEMLRWTKAGGIQVMGLVNRRHAEVALWKGLSV